MKASCLHLQQSPSVTRIQEHQQILSEVKAGRVQTDRGPGSKRTSSNSVCSFTCTCKMLLVLLVSHFLYFLEQLPGPCATMRARTCLPHLHAGRLYRFRKRLKNPRWNFCFPCAAAPPLFPVLVLGSRQYIPIYLAIYLAT